MTINVSKHAVKRFRERIDRSVMDDADVVLAIIESIENGAMNIGDGADGAVILRTRRPHAMRVVVRGNSVLTVKWPRLQADRFRGLRRSGQYNHAFRSTRDESRA